MSSAELQQKALQTRTELQAVTAQVDALKHSLELAKHTTAQIKANSTDSDPVWQAVGRMFVLNTVGEYNETVTEREAQVKQQLEGLDKKQLYYETTLNNLVKAVNSM